MSDATISREHKAERAVQASAQDPPILFLHGIDRHYRQGNVVLEILKGAELAIWPGQSVKLRRREERLRQLRRRVTAGS